MTRRFRIIGAKISDFLGFGLLGPDYKILSIVYLFNIFYTTLESVFVNTLLYRTTGMLMTVIIYRGITYIASAIAMQFAALLSQTRSPLWTVRIGSVLYLFMYFFLFFGINDILKVQYLVAILSGMGSAFYWSAHNTMVLGYTNRKNRDVGIGILGIISGLTTLIVPVISGSVISAFPINYLGYRIMFGIGMASVLAQTYFTMKLYPLIQKKHTSQLGIALQLIRKKVVYRICLSYDCVRGAREGVFTFILNMLLFELITNETLTGVNTFLTGLMSIVASWVYGKIITHNNRNKSVYLSITVLLLANFVLFFKMNAVTLMTFTAFNAFFQFFLLSGINSTTYDVVSYSQLSRRAASEIYAIREIALTVGRIIGLTLIALMQKTHFQIILAMFILTVVQYLAANLMKLAEKHLQTELLSREVEA